MKRSSRILSIILALGLLLTGIGTAVARQIDIGDLAQLDSSYAPQAVTVAEDDVEWAAANGDSISWVKPDQMGYFFVRDAGLETTKSGTAVWGGSTPASTAGQIFTIANGDINGATTTATYTLTASDYSTTTPTSTPLTGFPSVEVGGSTVVVTTANLNDGIFALLTNTNANATTTATFSYHVADSWVGSASATRRAKVTTTSDPAGEYVTIDEVASLSSSAAASATSRLFRGAVTLSSNAATQGTNSDGVWVQDGDTVTVLYLNSDGTSLDTDTVTVDGVKPTISNISPTDGTITNITNPAVVFEVTDTGSGITNVNPGTAVTITIRSTAAITTIAASAPAFQTIADGFRVIFATGTSWLTQFQISDSEGFTWEIAATDVAGNTKTLTGSALDLKIDITKPTVLSAVTGTDWDLSKATETTGQNTAVKVTFSEDVDASTVVASDFTVAGVQPSAAVVGTTTGHKDEVYLTVTAQAADAKPEVKVTGEVLDKAGNAALTTKKATATDGLKPTITRTVGKALSVKADAVKITVATDEKLAVNDLVVSVQGPTGASGNGKLTTTAPTPLSNEGTFTVVSGDLTVVYGASITATDLGNNTVDNLTTVTGEAVSASNVTPGTATTVIKLAKGPIADADFDGDLDKEDITSLSFSVNTATSSAITVVNASARTITVNVAVGAAETATVSYKYVAADVFEVDQSAPTVSFDPAPGSNSAGTFLKGEKARTLITRGMNEVMRQVDVLFAPTSSWVAGKLRGKPRRERTFFDGKSTLIHWTGPFNLTGQPSISVPCGLDSQGISIGFQISGRAFDEETVLRVAHA